jgi:hypothetical protein
MTNGGDGMLRALEEAVTAVTVADVPTFPAASRASAPCGVLGVPACGVGRLRIRTDDGAVDPEGDRRDAACVGGDSRDGDVARHLLSSGRRRDAD